MARPHQFWMVQGGGPASFQHDSRASAEAEANRLAIMNPGAHFYVMEAVAVHRRLDVERIVFRDDDELPF